VGLIIWSVSIVRRWQEGDILARNIWFCSHLVLCIFPSLWKFLAPESYTKHRITTMATIRCLRAIGVGIAFSDNQNFIWKPASGQFGCPLSLFVSQYMKLAYLLCQVLAHQVPFMHHIWLISLNAAVVIFTVPGRCQAECTISSNFGNCSVKWLETLAFLDKYWIFSASTPASMRREVEPWLACAVVQSLFAVRV
jgi:hypothetical protein